MLLQRRRHAIYYYMAVLHQRFFLMPDFTELEEEIEQVRQEVRECLVQSEGRKLMQLVDAQNLLREKISLASFIAGFKLAQESHRGLHCSKAPEARDANSAL